jgi:hypothetical protein
MSHDVPVMTLDHPGHADHRPGEYVRHRDDGTDVLVTTCQGCNWEYICGIIDDTRPAWEWFLMQLELKGLHAWKNHMGEMAASGTLGPHSILP